MTDFSKIAQSGLMAANTKLGAIANNLSNSETSGYKSQSVQFKALFSSGSSQQEGLGTTVESIKTNFEDGSIIPTSNPLHHAISGNGFFVTKNSNGGMQLSRVGLFEFKPNGVLVNNNGDRVQGYSSSSMTEAMSDIVLDKSPLPPKSSTHAELKANLGTSSPSESITSNFSIYDSLGKEYSLKLSFSNKITDPNTGEAKWQMTAKINNESLDIGNIQFSLNGKIKTNEDPFNNGKITIDLDGKLKNKINGVPTLSIDMSKMTGFDGDSVIYSQSSNGSPLTDFEKYQTEKDGKIVSYYKDGRSKLIGQIGIATVDNPEKMQLDGNYFVRTTGSGAIKYGLSGQAGFGDMTAGCVEGSNVNTTEELVNMISASRFFQVNSKAIKAKTETQNALFQAI